MDEFVEGYWVWIFMMQRLGFIDWSLGNLSDSSFNEDCMEIIVGYLVLIIYWNDDDCFKKVNFICEVLYVYFNIIFLYMFLKCCNMILFLFDC